MKIFSSKYIVLTYLLIGCSLFAADGREGAMTAISVGLGQVYSTLDEQSTTNEIGDFWSIKLGYGITPNIIAFIEGSAQSLNKGSIQNSAGIGISYYFDERASSPYLSAYVGEANEHIEYYVSGVKKEEYSDGSFGDLWKIGLGYEYKQWFCQLDYFNANNKRVESSGVVGSIGYNFHIFR
jgi:hypothetical protein